MSKKTNAFLDNTHPGQMAFIDICNKFTGNNIKVTRRKLEKLIEQDENFLDPYLMLMEIDIQENNLVAARDVLEKAYQLAVKAILNENGNWPDELLWSWLENRHIIRTLLNKGIFYWTLNEFDKALAIFSNLLRTDPDDHVGARFYILAIRQEMDFGEYQDRFIVNDESDAEQMRWFEQNYKDYPRDFTEWVKQAGD